MTLGPLLIHHFNQSQTTQSRARPILYRGASLIRNHRILAPYSEPVPTTLRWSYGGGRFLMSEVPLYHAPHTSTPPTVSPFPRRAYRGTSLMRKRPFLGPYSMAMPKALQGYLVFKKTYLKKTVRI